MGRDHLAYGDLTTDLEQRVNTIVRKHHALIVLPLDRRNTTLSDAPLSVPMFVVGGWVWLYGSAATFRQGAKADTSSRSNLHWTDPYKSFAVGPCSPLTRRTAPPQAL